MVLPSKIMILGIPYSIEEVELVSSESLLDGSIDLSNQTIRINNHLAPARKEQVFMHEIMHGIFHELGMDELRDDERAVQSIASALHHLLTTQTIFS